MVNKRVIKDLSKIYPNLKEGDMIKYTSDKIEKLLELFGTHIWELYNNISDFYDLSNYYDEDEEDIE